MSNRAGPRPTQTNADQQRRDGTRLRTGRWGAVILMVALLALGVGGVTGAVLSYQLASHSFGLAFAGGSSGTTDLEKVAERVLPTVVQLRVRSGDDGSTGSGVLLSSDGLILTNNHVVAPAAGGAGQVTVLFDDGNSTHATIVGRDPSSDIAEIGRAHV